MNPKIHPAVSVSDAVDMLDTRVPLLYSEISLIVVSLWDEAFKAGVKQGRNAGIEYAQGKILRTVRELAESAGREEVKEALREYEDPTTAIRGKLENAARMRGRTKIDGRYTN